MLRVMTLSLLLFSGCTMQPMDEYSVIPTTNNPDFCSGGGAGVPGATF